ncbi:uncharacterized protein LOC116271061 [Papio anubis]|uniref:uncharacterized protein LOC116271061 n=1 Tax=Papio anubis TaxID=9555 RepID=UPI0012AE7F6F|nr:uncharacterized protein LOC116271061 [Papio anubis]
MTHGDCLTSSNSGGRGNSQRTQPRRAPFLPCPEPPRSSPASTGLQRNRENRSSQRWFCNSSSAGDTRSRRPQTPQGCARRHGAGRRTDGAPPPWTRRQRVGKPRKPRVPSEASRHPVPSRSANLGQDMGPRRLWEPGAPQNPRGRSYLAAGDATRSGCPRAQRLP